MMAGKSVGVVEGIKDITECCICTETFSNPRMLPCIHTFCLRCLERTGSESQKKPGDKMPCPLCRKEFIMPVDGFLGIPKNFFMDRLMEMAKLSQPAEMIRYCDSCETSENTTTAEAPLAKMYCMECEENICDDCINYHKKQKRLKNHQIVAFGNQTINEKLIKRTASNNCDQHNRYLIEMYCHDCRKAICMKCFAIEHKGHSCSDVDVVAEKFRKQIEAIVEKVKTSYLDGIELRTQVDVEKANFIKQIETAEKEIIKRANELKDLVDRNMHALLGQLASRKAGTLKALQIQRDEIDMHLRILDSFKTYSSEIQDKGTSGDICRAVDGLCSESSELEQKHKSFTDQPLSSYSITFEKTNMECLLSERNIIGTFEADTVYAPAIAEANPSLLKSVDQVVSLRGLRNLGKTCYFNSVMQALVHTNFTFRVELENLRKKGDFVESLLKFLSDMQLANGKPFSPDKMLQMFGKKSPEFDDYSQHDSHEYFQTFMKTLRKAERDSSEAVDKGMMLTVVDSVFGGHFITVYICKKCGTPYHLCNAFRDISLSIKIDEKDLAAMSLARSGKGTKSSTVKLQASEGRDKESSSQTQELGEIEFEVGASETSDSYREALGKLMKPLSLSTPYLPSEKKRVTIYDCLMYFTRTRHIHNAYLCKDCLRRHLSNGGRGVYLTPAITQTLIFNPPAVLTLHLDRFDLEQEESVKRTDNVMITYGEYLDVAPFCSSMCLRNDSRCNNIWYSLYGVVVHHGSTLESGHNTAYVKIRDDGLRKFLQKKYFDSEFTKDQLIEMMHEKQPSETHGEPSGAWYCMNDSLFHEVTVEEVLNQEAYLLFYERII